jgi:hypothetical protein
MFIYLRPLSPPIFLFGVGKQSCKFGIWSNTQCIIPEYALHITESSPLPLSHTVLNIYAPIIYTAPCIMFWMGAYPLLGMWERVGPWNLRVFWAL